MIQRTVAQNLAIELFCYGPSICCPETKDVLLPVSDVHSLKLSFSCFNMIGIGGHSKNMSRLNGEGVRRGVSATKYDGARGVLHCVMSRL